MKASSRSITQFFIHLLGWGLVFVLPFMIFNKDSEIILWDRILHHVLVVSSLMLVFYSNYFIFTGKFLFQKKIWKFILINLVLIIGIGTLVHWWNEANAPVKAPLPKDVPHIRPFFFFIRDMISLSLMALLSTTIKITGKWYQMEAEHKEEENRHNEAELINLRQQLHPHFLFNTLNNIYALTAISPEKAQDAVLELSKLLRYVLYENDQKFVPLEREIEFIKNYIELMRLRLIENINLQTEINIQGHEHDLVAPMLFVTLIENAFKHGICQSKASFIHISIQTNDDSKLLCIVRNSYLPKSKSDKSGSGIGLGNLRKRLNILYPKQHHLDISLTNDTYSTILSLQLIKNKVD